WISGYSGFEGARCTVACAKKYLNAVVVLVARLLALRRNPIPVAVNKRHSQLLPWASSKSNGIFQSLHEISANHEIQAGEGPQPFA
ncbi:MAG: hypothetical protein WBA92_03310, partial [Pseudorhodobacter sp.]